MRILPSVAVLSLCGCSGNGSAPARVAPAVSARFDFDSARAGELPAGWRIDSTNASGPAATWSVQPDESASSAPNVLALTSVNHSSQDTFNLCWTPSARFRDGVIELAVKPGDGEVDQGGGVVWRVQGPDDYYLCRYNPLETNFRVYVVRGGVRTQLATAIASYPGRPWHRIRVEHVGDRITCSLDGAKLLVVDDATLVTPGGVGVWTKADARTSFDDIEIESDE